MEREKLWIGMWMRENERERERERERGKFIEDDRGKVGEQLDFKLFQISNYKIEFHKIHI